MLNNILISRETRKVLSKDSRFIGIEGENLQEVLVFNLDQELEGQGIVEIQFRDETKGYIEVEKTYRGYELPVKSSLLTQEGIIKMQLRIVQLGKEVFKSEIIRFDVDKAINATETIPEQYPTWIDNLEALKLELQKAEEGRVSAEENRVSAEKQRAETFNQMEEAVDNAIGSIVDLQEAYDKNAQDKIKEFNDNATNQLEAHNTNATNKITEFNNNVTTQTNAFNQNATDKTSDFDKNAQDKLDEYNANAEVLENRIVELEDQIINLETENENIKNQFPTGEAEGENITLNDSAEMEFKELRIGGNSWQETRSGKNEFSASLVENKIWETTGVMRNYTGYVASDGMVEVLGNTKYKLISDNSSDRFEGNLMFFDENKTFIEQVYTFDTFTTPENAKYITFHGTTANIGTTSKIMLLLSTETDLTYEPYGAMPSPEFRSEIRNVGDNGSANITVCNGNLFDISKAKRACGACSLQNNGDSIDVIATNTEQYTSANIDITDLFKEGETIYAKADFVASGSNTGAYRVQWANDIGLTKGDMILMSSTSGLVKNSTIPTKPEGATKLLLYLYGNVAGTVVIGDTVTYSKIMLSNQPITEYIPHQSQQFTFPLSEGQRMYKDSYLADDGVHHKRGHYIFTGTETINIGANYTNNTRFIINSIVGKIDGKVLCNYLVEGTAGKDEPNIDMHGVSGSIVMTVPNSIATTVEQLKAYLAEQYANGTPVTVEYELANEVIEPYTEEQQKVYNEINKAHSYKNVTHIFSTDEIKPINHVIYRKDWETLNQKQEDRILALENAVLGGN